MLAALYDPVFRVHLDRNTWAGANWFTVGAIAVATGVFLRNKSNLRLEVAEVNEIFRLVGFAFRYLRNPWPLPSFVFSPEIDCLPIYGLGIELTVKAN